MSLAGSWWGGHISLMGAYDAATDSALILDVWKYTDPFWVKIDKVCSQSHDELDRIDPNFDDLVEFYCLLGQWAKVDNSFGNGAKK